MTFEALGLSQALQAAVRDMGIEAPSEIQVRAAYMHARSTARQLRPQLRRAVRAHAQRAACCMHIQ